MKSVALIRKYLFIVFILFIQISIYAQIDSGYVDIKNGQIFYRIWGDGDPLVFINGGPGFSSEGYESYAIELAKHRKVILFDQRGTGKSWLKDMDDITIKKMVGDLESLRKHLKIEKWDVLGHSFGGQYAIYYTTKHGVNIGKLILSASPAYDVDFSTQAQEFKNVDYTHLSYLLELDEFKSLQEELQKDHPSKEAVLRAKRCAKARYYVYKKENFLTVAKWFANKVGSSTLVENKVRSSCEKTKVNTRKLRKFDHPVLILHGVSDFLNLTNPFRNHEIFPNSELELIYDSGHIMSVDQKDQYFELIMAFLKRKDRDKTSARTNADP